MADLSRGKRSELHVDCQRWRALHQARLALLHVTIDGLQFPVSVAVVQAFQLQLRVTPVNENGKHGYPGLRSLSVKEEEMRQGPACMLSVFTVSEILSHC